jgi:hypothetical protein
VDLFEVEGRSERSGTAFPFSFERSISWIIVKEREMRKTIGKARLGLDLCERILLLLLLFLVSQGGETLSIGLLLVLLARNTIK